MTGFLSFVSLNYGAGKQQNLVQFACAMANVFDYSRSTGSRCVLSHLTSLLHSQQVDIIVNDFVVVRSFSATAEGRAQVHHSK